MRVCPRGLCATLHSAVENHTEVVWLWACLGGRASRARRRGRPPFISCPGQQQTAPCWLSPCSLGRAVRGAVPVHAVPYGYFYSSMDECVLWNRAEKGYQAARLRCLLVLIWQIHMGVDAEKAWKRFSHADPKDPRNNCSCFQPHSPLRHRTIIIQCSRMPGGAREGRLVVALDAAPTKYKRDGERARLDRFRCTVFGRDSVCTSSHK
jgi:hypothetical protein